MRALLRRPVAVATVLLPVVLATAALGAGHVVLQKSRAFTVRAIEIAKGDVVRFDNADTFTHQIYVHAPSMTFESDEQAPGTSVSVRFPSAGTFEVRCQIHPKMLLIVKVR